MQDGGWQARSSLSGVFHSSKLYPAPAFAFALYNRRRRRCHLRQRERKRERERERLLAGLSTSAPLPSPANGRDCRTSQRPLSDMAMGCDVFLIMLGQHLLHTTTPQG